MHEHAKELKLLYRRTQKEVAQMLPQDHTEIEIAWLLQVQWSTICRDVKVLKELSQRFVFDLGNEDLTYYYKLYPKLILRC